jgi:hypothetical protein
MVAVVVGSKFVVRRMAGEHVISGDEEAVGDGNDRLLVSRDAARHGDTGWRPRCDAVRTGLRRALDDDPLTALEGITANRLAT